jgi:hypothetical protein
MLQGPELYTRLFFAELEGTFSDAASRTISVSLTP